MSEPDKPMDVDVYLRFSDRLSEGDREQFLRRLRAECRPGFELVVDDDVRLHISNSDGTAAVGHVQVVVRSICDALGIDQGLIQQGLDPNQVYRPD